MLMSSVHVMSRIMLSRGIGIEKLRMDLAQVLFTDVMFSSLNCKLIDYQSAALIAFLYCPNASGHEI